MVFENQNYIYVFANTINNLLFSPSQKFYMKNLITTLLIVTSAHISVSGQSIQNVTTLTSTDHELQMYNIYTEYSGKLYFASRNSLWVTDGTGTGTQVVKEFASYSIPSTSDPASSIYCLTTLNNQLIFTAYDSTYGFELWTSDGTTNGTKMLLDLNPAAGNGVYNGYHNKRPQNFEAQFAKSNGNIYFYGDDGTQGIELWKSDGTISGTVQVKNINLFPYKGMADTPNLRNIVVTSNNKIIFHATDTTYGDEIWISDGTEIGTKIIKDITPGNYGSVQGTEKYVVYDDKVLFNIGNELYITDGTEQNTVKLSTNTRILSADYVNYKNKIYFYGRTVNSSGSLVESDGTAQGTKEIMTVFGGNFGFSGKEINLVVFKNLLYFTGRTPYAASPVSGLWSSDGTAQGTKLVDTTSELPQNVTVFNNKLYFRKYDADSLTIDIWQSDGTGIGTKKVNHNFINANTHGSSLIKYLNGNGNLMHYGSNLVFPFVYNTVSDVKQLYKIGQWPDNISNTSSTSNIAIHPNPVLNEFTIKGNSISSVSICNIAGNVIHTQSANEDKIIIDTHNWTCGLYMVTIKLSNGSLVYRKIIK